MLIHKYQKRWVNDFNSIKKVLESKLQHVAIEIEHIGSTSIHNLAAKPIIDIDIIYTELNSIPNILEGLENLGYYHNGDQGLVGRDVFKRNLKTEFYPILDLIKHHLYACHSSNEELQRHILFRDFLRQNENKRLEYENLKYSIAEKAGQDRKEYARLKEVMACDFIESVIELAQPKYN